MISLNFSVLTFGSAWPSNSAMAKISAPSPSLYKTVAQDCDLVQRSQSLLHFVELGFWAIALASKDFLCTESIVLNMMLLNRPFEKLFYCRDNSSSSRSLEDPPSFRIVDRLK